MPRRRGDSGNGRIGKNGKDYNDGKGGKGGKGSENQSTLSTISSADERLEVSTLETWLWDAACAIRGATDAPKFKDFILPLIFFKRLSDVFDDEFAKHVTDWDDDVALARQIVEDDRSHSLRSGHGAHHPVLCAAGVRLECGEKPPGGWSPGRVRYQRHARGGQAQSGSERRAGHQGLQRTAVGAAHFRRRPAGGAHRDPEPPPAGAEEHRGGHPGPGV